MGGGGGKGGSYSNSAADKLADLSQQLFNETSGLRHEFETQGQSVMRSGGVGTNVPLVQRAIESAKASLSNTLKQTDSNLASSGLAGTPFGEMIKSSTSLQGEMGVGQAGSSAASWLLNMIPGFATGTTGQGISGMSGAANAISQTNQANASSSAAKGNQMSSIFSALIPKVGFNFGS